MTLLVTKRKVKFHFSVSYSIEDELGVEVEAQAASMAEQPEGSNSQSPTKSVNSCTYSKDTDLDAAGGMQMFPTMSPAFIPNFDINGIQEHSNRGAGLYAVPVLPSAGPPIPNILIPLTYSVPTTTSSSMGGATGQENEPPGQPGAQLQQPGGPQGPVNVRPFQIAINIDLGLLLKLAAVIYLFHQDGSRKRLAFLVLIASVVYLYQTGMLEPLKRWLARSFNRVPQPVRPPRDALPADDVNLGNENAARAGRALDDERGHEAENHDQAEDGPAELEPAGQHNANRNPLWALMKEIQIFVLGFITSLLPGFQHLD